MRLEKQVAKLQETMAVPDYQNKVPPSIQEQNSNKVSHITQIILAVYKEQMEIQHGFLKASP